jgi:hypothetical protein
VQAKSPAETGDGQNNRGRERHKIETAAGTKNRRNKRQNAGQQGNGSTLIRTGSTAQ